MKNSKFQFDNPVLSYLKFEMNDNFNEMMYSGIKLLGKTEIVKSQTENKAQVSFRLLIGEETESSPFFIDIEMCSNFAWEDELKENDDTVDKLLKANAPSLLLGYIRPLIATITSASKYPSFHVPFLDMQDNEAEIKYES